ncbi:PHP domain-containing protein [Bifidobacterium cuniculi]|uniref:PHP C-terminal domain-containing protein n=1 Tax=Bifidobacterium cuniculi TaxID=1688 RepID=A0A087B2K7_9BIFI|nr:PHP domain-containing protein [Bifidobacterium cuniculi]KFI65257.1 PHP C-terminal domain-containing protein [Bifidobacterium cuniculi]
MTLANTPPTVGWDLHCHTVFSDGTVTPAGMIQEAGRLGLHGVAIADHDTTAGWQEARLAAEEAGMPLVRGSEITSHDDGVSVHMLAYQYDPDDAMLAGLFARTRAARRERARQMVERLGRDYPITWESVLAQIKEGSRTTVGRPHIADALVAVGVYPTRSDAFAGAVSSHSPYYIPTPSPSAEEVIAAVRHAGGVSVVAHAADPSRNRRLLSRERIEHLAGEGLDGLEVWHRGNPVEGRRMLLDVAERCGLLVTGGSDWHGAGKPNVMGEFVTDDATVREIVRRGTLPLVQ